MIDIFKPPKTPYELKIWFWEVWRPGISRLFPPSQWIINTLSADDLTKKLTWCKAEIEAVDKEKYYSDYAIKRREYKQWLNGQIDQLQRWLDTLPDEAESVK